MSLYFGFSGFPADADRLADAADGETQSAATATSYCRGPLVHADGAVTLLLHGEPRLRDGPGAPRTPLTGAEVVAKYRQHGIDFIKDLAGPFALAVLDPDAGCVHLAVDRMGIERLAYAQVSDGIVFSDSAEIVAAFAPVGTGIRLQSLYDFFFFDMIPSPATVFDGVAKLPPASVATFRDGRLQVSRYWSPTETQQEKRSFAALKIQLDDTFEHAVRETSPGEQSGAFLSGGLDSSSVLGMLGRVKGKPAPSFSIGFGIEEYDEMKFARIANDHFGAEGHEYQLTPQDIVAAIPIVAQAYDEPFGNSSAVPTYFCARLAAEHGIDHVLAGDGGDEIFAGNERYARQKMFGIYGRLPAWLRRGLLDPVTSAVAADSRITPLRKLKSYVDQARIPLPDRFESWNFVYREGAGRLFEPDFLAAIDTDEPLALMRDVWGSTAGPGLVDRMLRYDWRFTLADNDLRKVGTMCRIAGVRVSYPMLDPDMIDLSIRVPAGMKMRRFELRSFFRRAMQDFLPAAIIDKGKHGFGLPFGVWLKNDEALRGLVFPNLTALRSRGIVSRTFLDRVLEQHRHGHASYYGYIIWDLVMLEEWLQSRISPGPIVA